MAAKHLQLDQAFGDFILKEKIGEGSFSLVFRAERHGEPCALKILKAEKSTPQTRVLFRREAAYLAKIAHPGVTEIRAISETADQLYVVMELLEGKSLADHLTGTPFEESWVRAFAISVASTLQRVHEHGLIHRDIKPQNIFCTNQGAFKLIDFGFARSFHEISDEGGYSGTFLYSSPEQLGVLRRPSDERSDLFSFGVVLFELASGKRPYSARDAADLFQLYVSSRAPALNAINPQISKEFSDIVDRLLAPDPEDRFSSSSELLRALISADKPSPIQDSPSDNVLVGRRRERDQIFKAWHTVSQSSPDARVVVVEGEPGAGKTHLIRATVREMELKGALVLRAKCAQESVLPMAPFRTAIDEHLKKLATLSPNLRRAGEERILQAIGAWAPILNHFTPGLSRLLQGGQKPLEEAGDHFLKAVTEFFVNLIEPRHPLILVIDDFQWMDKSTRQVIDQIIKGTRKKSVLLLFSARNDPRSLEITSEFLRSLDTEIQFHIRLGPLSASEVQNLVRANVGTGEVPTALSERVAQLSRGNPFAVGEYIRSLIDQGALRYEWGLWTLDEAHFSRLNLTQDILEIVIGRTRDLPSRTQQILSIAAILGSPFDLNLLSEVSGFKEAEIAIAVEESRLANLIESSTAHSFVFVHDRVQEALLSHLSESQRKHFHQLAAEIIDNMTETHLAEHPELIYAKARHYANGSCQNPERIFASSRAAGLLAAKNFANQEAYSLLNVALNASADAGLPTDPEVTSVLGDVSLRINKPDEAFRRLRQTLEITKDPFLKAEVHHRLSRMYMSNFQAREAWNEVNAGFEAIGLPTLEMTVFQWIKMILIWMLTLISPNSAAVRRRARGTQSRRLSLDVLLSQQAGFSGFYNGWNLIIVPAAIRGYIAAMPLAPSREKVFGLSIYGCVLNFFGFAKWSARHIQRAKDLATSLNDPVAYSVAVTYEAYGLFHAGREYEAVDFGLDAVATLNKWLAIEDIVTLTAMSFWGFIGRGYGHLALQPFEYSLGLIEATGLKNTMLDHSYKTFLAQQMVCLHVQGRLKESHAYFESSRSLGENPNCQFFEILYATYLLIIGYDQGYEDERITESINRLDKLKISPFFADLVSRFHHVYMGHLRLHQLITAPPNRRPDALKRFKKAMFKLRLGTDRAFFKLHFLIIKGGYLSLIGRSRRALRLLDKAAKIATKTDSVWAHFEIFKHRALHFKRRNEPYAAKILGQMALALARQFGWVHREKLMIQLLGETSTSLSGATDVTPARSKTQIERHLNALLNVSLATSNALDPTQQAKAALDEVVRILSAERALLFMSKNGNGDMDFVAGRNANSTDIENKKDFSQTVIDDVRIKRKAVIVKGVDEGALMGAESVIVHNLRSVIAAPILIRDHLAGIVYLDNRVTSGVFTIEDVEILQAIANQIGVAFKTAQIMKDEIERREMAKDLEVASMVQALLLPAEPQIETRHFELYGHYQSASQAAGDWWWYKERSDGRLIVFLGDATGHGVGPAMISAVVAGCFHAVEECEDMREVLDILNSSIYKICRGEYLMAMTVLELDPKSGEFSLWLAGTPPIFKYSPGQDLECLTALSSLLGTNPDLGVQCVKGKIGPDERFLLMTDGLTEQTLKNEAQIGLRQVQKQFLKSAHLPLQIAHTNFIQWFDSVRSSPLKDDVTIVQIGVKNSNWD